MRMMGSPPCNMFTKYHSSQLCLQLGQQSDWLSSGKDPAEVPIDMPCQLDQPSVLARDML